MPNKRSIPVVVEIVVIGGILFVLMSVSGIILVASVTCERLVAVFVAYSDFHVDNVASKIVYMVLIYQSTQQITT